MAHEFARHSPSAMTRLAACENSPRKNTNTVSLRSEISGSKACSSAPSVGIALAAAVGGGARGLPECGGEA